jgi:hypothetical protein
MALDFTVKVAKIYPEQSGSNEKGDWNKQSVLVETLERLPRSVCITFWGERVSMVKSLKESDIVKVYFNLESRFYIDKWHTEVKAWKIEPISSDEN